MEALVFNDMCGDILQENIWYNCLLVYYNIIMSDGASIDECVEVTGRDNY